MQIRIKMKPTVMKANTKYGLMQKIQRNFGTTSYTYSTYGQGMKSSLHWKNDCFVMVNMQKFRSKRGVRKAHWIAYVYTFDVNFLKAADLKVVQHTRHFDIMKK